MKKRLIIICIFLISLLIGCNNANNNEITNINISELPYKLEYNLNESLDFNGLIVEIVYDNNMIKKIDNYEIIYSNLTVGENIITIRYHEFETSFTINITNSTNDIEKLELLQYNDYLKNFDNDFNINDYEHKFINVSYGVYRGTNMMIVYDELNYVKTNTYGYEISVDENGFIVDTNKNVNLVENGFVISGHGTSSTLLKQLNVGDYVIFLDNIIFTYSKNNVNNNQINKYKTFIKFLDIIKKIDLIKDVTKYNQIITLLNEQIPLLNNLDLEYNIDTSNQVYEKLKQIDNEITNYNKNNIHKYSYIDTYYQYLDKLEIMDNNSIIFVTYTDKLYKGGYRNTDTLVYYDKTNLINRNNYGCEIAVDENNKIIDIDILVDLPENGYILSGHGAAADFIKGNLKIGDKVEITNDTVNFYRDLYNSAFNTIVEEYNFTIRKINEHINLSIPHDYEYINRLVEYVNILINTIYTNISNNNLQNNIHYQKSLIKYYLEIIYSQLIDYKINNSKAMWYYPFQNNTYDDTTLESIQNTLDKFKEMGFNEIIILPFKGNYSLYDSKYFYQYEEIKNYSYGKYGNDYLLCFISEAHQRGLIVNAFTQTFRCYEEGSKLLNESHYQVDINGEYSRGQCYYYDICNDFVQETLTSWYVELVEKYDFDKIEYDIIRYSVSNLNKYLEIDDISHINNLQDPGYTEYSLNKFKEKYQINTDVKQLILTNKEIRKKWLEFKQQELTNFITNTTNAIKKINPNIIMTAAVFEEEDVAKKSYLQDYKHWLELNIIDQIEPMVYSDVNSYVDEYVNYYKDNFYMHDYRIGLGNITSLWDIIIQIELSSKYGFVLFRADEYLQDKYYEVFKNNHHYQYPINYNDVEEVKKAVKLDLIDKINNYYEIKNNENYDYLIELINNNNMSQLKQEIINLKDLNMSNYLLEIINAIS